MASAERQQPASQAGNATPEATSLNENVQKRFVCFCEDAEKPEVSKTGIGCGTSAVERSSVSLPVKNGEEAPALDADLKKGRTSAVIDSFQQHTGDKGKKAKGRRIKEQSWDKEKQVKLICAEGTAIFVDRQVAVECDLFRRMLERSEQAGTTFGEGHKAEIKLPTIRRRILEKTIEYLEFRRNWYRDGGHSGMFEVESDIALELLFVSNYLGLADDDTQTMNTPDLC